MTSKYIGRSQAVVANQAYSKAEADARFMDINEETLPSQSGQAGNYLTTDGTDASWAVVDLSSKVDKTPDSSLSGNFDAIDGVRFTGDNTGVGGGTPNDKAVINIPSINNKVAQLSLNTPNTGDWRVLYRSKNSDGTWQDWTDFYTQRNLLGTVSQSSGIPTGAVIQNGSNANGRYTKFADGTLMCYAKPEEWHPEFFGGEFDWTFPAAFTNAPVVVGTNGTRFTTAAVEAVCVGASGAYDCSATRVGVRHGSTRSADFSSTLIAIGRWF